ncbi:AzlD domain-containing protein [Haloplanus aerogenes]|uniref:AzlD domain-containing protein n=1 Tax=Haloplanus aerogenes TaxID=660522 RepID=A0A3M0DTB6_9EURY|nr:AzlD domain-containing protein [Haloplanus aerogenes]AZH24389.1 AzlD domain-containing protein [Haloplanus aerogenes]RMB23970.1 branched-subunit amino acid transport protein [Haloplanus aerogenes]
MTTDYGPLAIWAVVLAVGVATFAIRYSFIYLFGRIDGVPPRVEEGLRFVPAAVLAALVAPSIVDPGPTVVATVVDGRFLAGVVAALVAWYTDNMFATIAVGLFALWTFGAVL